MGKIAIIDMGTNTFHLLLAETGPGGNYRIIHRDHEAVKIGKGGINEAFIRSDAYQRAIDAMKKFKRSIDDHGISDVYAFGTSALRNASNGPGLKDEIMSVTGIDVTIISGEEEAGLIFAGIREALDLGEKASLVMDIGAGSVEFIIGTRTKVMWKRSFEIGGQRLLERFMKHDPIKEEEVAALDEYFHQSLHPLLGKLEEFQPEVLVGSSGSFDTLSEIFCRRNEMRYEHDSPETPLTIAGFYAIYNELIRKDRAQRMDIPGMIEMRVDMIVVACSLIRFVLKHHPFNAVRVSTYSLKEGALAKLATSS